jgi:hypothetical protein
MAAPVTAPASIAATPERLSDEGEHVKGAHDRRRGVLAGRVHHLIIQIPERFVSGHPGPHGARATGA